MKNIIFALTIFVSLSAVSQSNKNIEIPKDTISAAGYPSGIYTTKEAFLKKKPDFITPVVPKGLYGLEKPDLAGEIVDNCFFFYLYRNTKITKAFAISYKGSLYLQIGPILDNRNRKDKSQSGDFPNSFVRVKIEGEHYLYTELNLSNVWAKGLSYNIGTQPNRTSKPAVWDFKNDEFNIFRNCEDFNTFIAVVYPKGVIADCSKKELDIEWVKNIIGVIK